MAHKRRARAKNYLLNLARRAEVVPEDAYRISTMLTGRVAEYWEMAVEVAIEAAEEPHFAQVDPIVHRIIESNFQAVAAAAAESHFHKVPLSLALRTEVADETFRHAAALLSKAAGLRPNVEQSLCRYAASLKAEDKLEAAARLYGILAEAKFATYGALHAEILASMADMFTDDDRRQDAANFFGQSIEIYQRLIDVSSEELRHELQAKVDALRAQAGLPHQA